MEQASSGVGFREVDREGNPVRPEPRTAGPEAWTTKSGPTLNPFIMALWLLAAALIGGGVGAFLYAMANQFSPNGQVPISFLVLTNAPYAIFLGIAALLCLLFWHALQWQRRRA